MATTPKDRNEAVRDQLLKKRQQTEQQRKALAPGEMVDDALARGVASFGKWIRANSRNVQIAIVGVAVAGAGYAGYDWWLGKQAQAATAALVKAEVAERGRIGAPESKKAGEDDDGIPVFKSVEEKRRAALADYRAVGAKFPGSGAAILARLGEAGVLLDQRDFDGALVAFRDVKSTKLAAADVSVRVRAMEGIGLALEAKKDIEGSLTAFRELENTDVRGYKELGQFQQARVLAARDDAARGDTAKAVELLRAAREKLRTATTETPFGERPMYPYLQTQVDDLLRALDPTAVPPPPTAGGPNKSMNPEQLQRLREELQRRMREANESGSGNEHPAPAPAPSGSH